MKDLDKDIEEQQILKKSEQEPEPKPEPVPQPKPKQSPIVRDEFTVIMEKYQGRMFSDDDYIILSRRLKVPITHIPKEGKWEHFIQQCRAEHTYSYCAITIQSFFKEKSSTKDTNVLASNAAKNLEKKLNSLYDLVKLEGFQSEETLTTQAGKISYKTNFNNNELLVNIANGDNQQHLLTVTVKEKEAPTTKGDAWTPTSTTACALTYPVAISGAFLLNLFDYIGGDGSLCKDFLYDSIEYPALKTGHVIKKRFNNLACPKWNRQVTITESGKSYTVEEFIKTTAAQYDTNQEIAKLKQAAFQNIEDAIKRDVEVTNDFLNEGF